MPEDPAKDTAANPETGQPAAPPPDTDPILLTEPQPEPAPAPAPPPSPPPARRSIALPVIVAVLALGALGALAWQRGLLTPAPAPDLSGIEARLSALETAPAPIAPPDPRIDSLLDRLSALETRLTALEAAPAPADPTLAQDLAALRAEVATLSGTAAPQDLRPLIQAELAAWEDAATARLAEAEAATAAATTRATALADLGRALDTGAPYGEALAALGPGLPPVLTDNAAGLPALPALQAEFPDAARAALDAALRAAGGDGMADRLWTFLRLQTGARSTAPRDGTDPDAILSRAEAALATGDLTTALAELATLPPEAQAALTDWTARAQLHLAARAALATLNP